MKNILKKIGKIVKKNKYEIALAILILIAAFLRIYKQAEYIDFFGDVGRDMIVAKHIAEDMRWTQARPYVAATPHLNNSTFYFNFLGFLWFLFPSILSINMFHTVISLSVIVLGYLIGKELVNKNVGIVIATYFTFSFYFIHVSRSIWQPNLIPYFFMAGLYFCIRSFKKPKLKYLYLSILFFFFCLNIHYSTLLIIPIISFWLIKRHHEILKINKLPKLISWLSFSTYLCILFFTWSALVDLKLQKLIQLFSQNTYSIEKIVAHGHDTVILFSKFIYGNNNYSPAIYFIFITTIIFSLTNKKIKTSKAAALIHTLNFSIIVAFFFERNIHAHYYGPLFIVSYISSAIIVNKLIKIKLLKLLIFASLLVLFLHSTLDNNKFIGLQMYFGGWERHDYRNAKKIAETIIKDYQNENSENSKGLLLNVKIGEYKKYRSFDIGQYYIFLEEITDRRLIKVSKKSVALDFYAGDNLQIIEKKPKFVYIVCFRFPHNTNLNNECIRPILDRMIAIKTDNVFIKKIDGMKHYGEYTSLYRVTENPTK